MPRVRPASGPGRVAAPRRSTRISLNASPARCLTATASLQNGADENSSRRRSKSCCKTRRSAPSAAACRARSRCDPGAADVDAGRHQLPALERPVDAAGAHPLYAEGGLARFYRGLWAALLQAPLSRFGDTAAKRPAFSAAETVTTSRWRSRRSPRVRRRALPHLDHADRHGKTLLQVQGPSGMALSERVASTACSRCTRARSSFATLMGHYPWFITYNWLQARAAAGRGRRELLRSALIGFCCSFVSDCVSNSVRVVKTAKRRRARRRRTSPSRRTMSRRTASPASSAASAPSCSRTGCRRCSSPSAGAASRRSSASAPSASSRRKRLSDGRHADNRHYLCDAGGRFGPGLRGRAPSSARGAPRAEPAPAP